MTRAGPLRWVTGAGWLILVGGEGEVQGIAAEVDDRLLARADFSSPIAFLPTASGSPTAGESLLECYAGLGGPRGYVVPVLNAVDAQREENYRLLAEAGLIILGDGDGLALARALRDSLALQGIADAFARGALVVGLGAGAAPLGEWIAAAEAPAGGARGWGWVGNAVIVPHFAGSAREPDLQSVLRMRPGLVGIGIPEGTALALGPEGQVETWGEGEVTVVVVR
ncbi:MAG TPA: hypothetical protein EYP77_06885 [Anaerolineae bacterium]|nr:hypothetical protein [Anaerolineae bacterium]